MNSDPVILWDIGNVLVRWDPRNLYSKMFEDRAELDRFLGEVCTMDWHGRHDSGEAMADTAAELAETWPQYSRQIHAWRARWPEMFDGDIEGSVALLQRFSAEGRRQYALTNFPAEKWPEFLAEKAWLRHFADIVVSGREGVRKPAPEVFALFEARAGARPQDVIFIDDSAPNIAAAAALGYDAILFEGPQALERAFAARGLI